MSELPVLLFDVQIHLKNKDHAGQFIGGIERVCTEELLRLIRSGHYEIYLVSSLGDEKYIPILQKNIPELSFCKTFPLYVSFAWWALLIRKPIALLIKILSQTYVGSYNVLPFFRAFILKLWGMGLKPSREFEKIKSRKIIYYTCFNIFPLPIVAQKNIIKVAMIHDISPLRFPDCSPDVFWNFFMLFYSFAVQADYLFFMSEFTRDDFYSCFKTACRENSITYGAADQRFHRYSEVEILTVKRKYKIPERAPYALTVAASSKRKNVDKIIAAFVTFKERNPGNDTVLVIAGRIVEQEKELSALVHKHADFIFSSGFVADGDLPILYSGALMYIFLSSYEGFGLPILEAFQSGVPVIASQLTSLPEIGGEAAEWILPDQQEKLAVLIKDLTLNCPKREKLISAGEKQARLFSWDKHVYIIDEVLKQLAEDK